MRRAAGKCLQLCTSEDLEIGLSLRHIYRKTHKRLHFRQLGDHGVFPHH